MTFSGRPEKTNLEKSFKADNIPKFEGKVILPV